MSICYFRKLFVCATLVISLLRGSTLDAAPIDRYKAVALNHCFSLEHRVMPVLLKTAFQLCLRRIQGRSIR
jgi:hypothetical protein